MQAGRTIGKIRTISRRTRCSERIGNPLENDPAYLGLLRRCATGRLYSSCRICGLDVYFRLVEIARDY